MFLRIKYPDDGEIQTKLEELYLLGWRVVSHAVSAEEYSFVLEQKPGLLIIEPLKKLSRG